MRFCRETILGPNSEKAVLSCKDDGLDEVNEAILLALSDEPFCSGPQISRRISVPESTAYCPLVDSLHFTVRHQTSSLVSSQTLRQSEERPSRVTDPISRLPVVHLASRIRWGSILILDESRVMVLLVDKSDHEMGWLPDGDEVPDRENHTIQSPKLMLTFVWNPDGFQVVDDV
jgi:hypothetical protein